jgi:hypothetical protein
MTTKEQLAQAVELVKQFKADIVALEVKYGSLVNEENWQVDACIVKKNNIIDNFVLVINDFPPAIIIKSFKEHFGIDSLVKFAVDDNKNFLELSKRMSDYLEAQNKNKP